MKLRPFAAVLATTTIAALAAMPGTASAIVCSPAPGNNTLQVPLLDNNCTQINLSSGTYTSTGAGPADFVLDHSATITGSGAGATTITTTRSPGDVLAIDPNSTTLIEGVSLSGAVNGSGLQIQSLSPTTVRNSVIASNTSPTGGAGIDTVAGLTLTDSVVRDNTTTGAQGGGIDTGTNTTVNISRVLFRGNACTCNLGGGALAQNLAGADANLTDVTFFQNTSTDDGGAIYTGSGGILNLTNATFVANVADSDSTNNGDGGGIYNAGSSVISAANTILADNVDNSAPLAPDCSGAITRQGYVLVKNGTNCSLGGSTTGSVTGSDPGLSAFGSLSGTTSGFRPLPGSIALNAVPSGNCGSSSDQRGLARPQGGACDIGAVEREARAPLPFSNPAPIAIPSIGSATPYPSQIGVSGLVRPVTDVTVRLDALNHTYGNDVEVLLVGPQGQSTVLMADAGDLGPAAAPTIDFNDSGPALVQNAPLLAGTFRPTTVFIPPTLAPPAPAGPYGTTLSVFDGTSGNGAWKLFVNDDTGGDSGSIVGGWALDVKTADPPVTPAPKCKKKKGKKAAASAKCKKKKKKAKKK